MKLLNKPIKRVLVLFLTLSSLLLLPQMAMAAVTIQQSNSSKIVNHVTTTVSTGNNTVKGTGTIKTGNSLSKVTIINTLNSNKATVPCCTTTSVPEFGLIPGAIAAFVSAGTFLFLKKRYI